MILRQNIPEFYQVRFAMDPTLSKYFLRWILLCPTLVCDGTLPKSISKRFRWDWLETKDLSQTIWGILCHLSQMDVVEMLFWNSTLRWIWVRLISKHCFGLASLFRHMSTTNTPNTGRLCLRWGLPKSISKPNCCLTLKTLELWDKSC